MSPKNGLLLIGKYIIQPLVFMGHVSFGGVFHQLIEHVRPSERPRLVQQRPEIWWCVVPRGGEMQTRWLRFEILTCWKTLRQIYGISKRIMFLLAICSNSIFQKFLRLNCLEDKSESCYHLFVRLGSMDVASNARIRRNWQLNILKSSKSTISI